VREFGITGQRVLAVGLVGVKKFVPIPIDCAVHCQERILKGFVVLLGGLARGEARLGDAAAERLLALGGAAQSLRGIVAGIGVGWGSLLVGLGFILEIYGVIIADRSVGPIMRRKWVRILFSYLAVSCIPPRLLRDFPWLLAATTTRFADFAGT
jgi:hypothetical protein